MRLEEIRDNLLQANIPVKIEDFSPEEKDTEGLWEDVAAEIEELKKWEEKRDAVMVAIVVNRIQRNANKIIQDRKHL